MRPLFQLVVAIFKGIHLSHIIELSLIEAVLLIRVMSSWHDVPNSFISLYLSLSLSKISHR
jgi:hypothetical protein